VKRNCVARDVTLSVYVVRYTDLVYQQRAQIIPEVPLTRYSGASNAPVGGVTNLQLPQAGYQPYPGPATRPAAQGYHCHAGQGHHVGVVTDRT